MALRIIKPGTAKASSVQQFIFTENSYDMGPVDGALLWPDLEPAPVNAPVKEPMPVEAPKPALDLAHLEKTAYENGFLQGEKAGMEIAEQKVEAVMRRYAESILEVGKIRSTIYPQVEREVVKLAIEVAKKIVHREIQADKEIIQTLVRVALSRVAEKSAVTIHLNPIDYEFLLEYRAELSQNEGREIALLADKSIERGGCMIQTECGEIDARIEEKFREVEHSFFEGFK
jgi:flagellar biosynthesis/type III secretory pathway protein FliH